MSNNSVMSRSTTEWLEKYWREYNLKALVFILKIFTVYVSKVAVVINNQVALTGARLCF